MRLTVGAGSHAGVRRGGPVFQLPRGRRSRLGATRGGFGACPRRSYRWVEGRSSSKRATGDSAGRTLVICTYQICGGVGGWGDGGPDVPVLIRVTTSPRGVCGAPASSVSHLIPPLLLFGWCDAPRPPSSQPGAVPNYRSVSGTGPLSLHTVWRFNRKSLVPRALWLPGARYSGESRNPWSPGHPGVSDLEMPPLGLRHYGTATSAPRQRPRH